MPTVREIYNQTIKPLSEDDRSELMGLILDDLPSEPPNTVRTIAQLEQALLDGLNSGPATPMTKLDWENVRTKAHAMAAQQRAKSRNHA